MNRKCRDYEWHPASACYLDDVRNFAASYVVVSEHYKPMAVEARHGVKVDFHEGGYTLLYGVEMRLEGIDTNPLYFKAT